MKRIIVLGALVLATLALAVATADSPARMRVDVPFAFYVQKTLMPPGQYIFEMRSFSPYAASSSAVLVRNQDRTVAAWVLTMPGYSTGRVMHNRVSFNRYGSTYFLSRVECLTHQANLKKTAAEKEYIVWAGAAQETTLVAQQ